MKFVLRTATAADCDLLASMNDHLIQDEGGQNTMSQLQLAERMRRWLDEGWVAVLVMFGGKLVIGYALFQQRQDEQEPQQHVIYLRQYFIQSMFRGKGYGQAVFEQLEADYFPLGAKVVVDVLASNPAGRRFWEKIGFRSYAIPSRLEKRG